MSYKHLCSIMIIAQVNWVGGSFFNLLYFPKFEHSFTTILPNRNPVCAAGSHFVGTFEFQN